MAQAPRYKLKLTKLDFVSPVDRPAQETARVLLLKRSGTFEATAHVAKVSDELGLVFCWAFTSTTPDGADYHDLQGDAIDPDFIKAAADFMIGGGATDEMHDGEQTGRVVFAMPMTPEIAKAYGVETKTTGLMVALKPPPEVFAKFKAGDYTGVSIAGSGTREAVKAVMARTAKGLMSTADRDSMPDGSFMYVEPGGEKDSEGKTTPRSLRHFPYKDGSGKVDMPHLRDAIGRIPQSSLPKDLRDKLQMKAEKLLAAQHDKVGKSLRGGESTVIATDEVDGHQHTIDLDDPCDGWSDQLTTSYSTSAGADNGHNHGWIFDPTTGAITILADSGHTHSVPAVVPPDVLASVRLRETGTRCPGCGEMCESGCNYCPKCGCSMTGNAVPDPDDTPSIVNINLRSSDANSTPSAATRTVGSQQETSMDPKVAKAIKDVLALPEPHRLYVAKLAPEEQAAFLEFDTAVRETAVKRAEDSDPEVYKTSSGLSIRKSHGPIAEQMARQADDLAKAQAKTAEELALSKAATEQARVEKRAAELIPLIGKSLAERVAIVKAVDAIADESVRNGAIEALKGANAAFQMLGKSIGATEGEGSSNKTPLQAWNDGLAAYAKTANIANPLDATIPFLKTADGKALKQALDAQRPMTQPN